jgi:exopolysaccharide biosynthesis protein
MTRTVRLALLLPALLMLAGATGTTALAQATYSVEDDLAEAEWEEDTLARGVVWKRAQVESLFGLPQSINVLEIDALEAKGVEIDVAFADTGMVPTSAMARRVGAVAAVNGSFFDIDSTGRPVVFAQSDHQPVELAGDEILSFASEAAVATEDDGDATVVRRAGLRWNRLARFEDVLASGPLLLWNEQVADLEDISFNVTHHPRTAAGITEDRRVIIATVDGRDEQAAGMTARELAWTMHGLGCVTAVNLDGGGSTTMWLRERGVVNYPSDNDRFDHEGERPVANAVVILAQQAANQ